MISSFNDIYQIYYNYIDTTFDKELRLNNPNYRYHEMDSRFKRIYFGSTAQFGPNYITGEPSDEKYTIIIDTLTNYVNITHLFKQFRRSTNQKLGNIIGSRNFKDNLSRIEIKLNEDIDKKSDDEFYNYPCFDFKIHRLYATYDIKLKNKPYEGKYMYYTLAVKVLKACDLLFSINASKLLYIILMKEGIDKNTSITGLTKEMNKKLLHEILYDHSVLPNNIAEYCENEMKSIKDMKYEIKKCKHEMIFSGCYDVAAVLVRYYDYDTFVYDSPLVKFKIKLLLDDEFDGKINDLWIEDEYNKGQYINHPVHYIRQLRNVPLEYENTFYEYNMDCVNNICKGTNSMTSNNLDMLIDRFESFFSTYKI